MPEPLAPTRWDLEARLIRRALRDPVFKQDLLVRSREIIEQELGAELPEDVAVVVQNEKAGELILVLPWEGHAQLGPLTAPSGDPGEESPEGAWTRARLRAARDPAWRAEVEANPRALVGDRPLPRQPGRGRRKKLRLKVHEEGPRIVRIVLPHPSQAALRLGPV